MKKKFVKDVVMEPMIWPERTSLFNRGGMLINLPACYALWFYYGIGYDNYVNKVRDKVYLEGDPEPKVNFRQLFTSCAGIYGVEPEEMVRFWNPVDAECRRCAMPIIPDAYRFNKPTLILPGA